MKALAEFVVRVMDLLEAEGSLLRSVIRVEARSARREVAGLAVGVAMLCVAVAICLASITLFAIAFWSWLEPLAGNTLALAATGAALLILGIGLFALVSRNARGATP